MYFVIARYVSINGTPCVLEMVSRLNEGRWIDANGSRFLLDRTRGEDMQLFLDPLTASMRAAISRPTAPTSRAWRA